MLTELLGIFFAVFLSVGVPILSYMTVRDPRIRQAPRLALYFSAVLSQWLLAIAGIVVVLLTPATFSGLGFRAVALPASARWGGLLVAISLAAMGVTIVLEKLGWWPEESDLVRLLIPATAREKLWAVLSLAPTAGFCEEFLYRGFLLVEFNQWFHSMTVAWIVSSIVFGFAHIYQGVSGVLRAAALGAFLAFPVIHLGSLYPSMAAHFVIDAVALGWLAPRFDSKGDSS
jgi:membrane protease YdiL (CAAX protease family)